MKSRMECEQEWIAGRIRPEELTRYLPEGGADFIDERYMQALLSADGSPDRSRIMDILQKSLAVETLTLEETAELLRVTDPELLEQMRATALQVKIRVYDNRIVMFAPLYLGNRCVNNCLYCGFKKENAGADRRVLDQDYIRRETAVLAGDIGHKRLILVYGEHPDTDIDYMVESIRTVYGTESSNGRRRGKIRRVNINAAPLPVAELRRLKEAGIGTYQVFQETYHHQTYRRMHPADTVKGNYAWRLYAMHRALEAGIEDVGIGALFGLYDWRFEVLGLVAHARELERCFGIGPHTISFPRLEPAHNAPLTEQSPFRVSDENFKRLMVVLRLSVPHSGMIVTAREKPAMRRYAFRCGCTQTDASTCIRIGGYAQPSEAQDDGRQQFCLGDTRSLDEVIREYAGLGYITSFCTAGYRCGRTGECIFNLLKSGQEGVFCKLNAIITFREWLDDFASPETKTAGEAVIESELAAVRDRMPQLYPHLLTQYEKTKSGERDLFF